MLNTIRKLSSLKPESVYRPCAAKRGYDVKWQRARKAYLRKNPLCVICESNGITKPATVVDHIMPHKGDYNRMWDSDNWQALCKPCHDYKTGTEMKRK